MHSRPGERILDVGCGTGDLTLAARQQASPAAEGVGIGAAPEMIEVTRRKAALPRARNRGAHYVVNRILDLSLTPPNDCEANLASNPF